ncbi:unnamed protein product [Linum tenue]|uniref:Major facilitator superfamily (MFS) profile domain-containing protein n=2 Tax=Linum tenue TaxID=586396 RepID=A0AAV0GYT0_9ROSI|nr:unnamed protein product [Linum tenue]
MMAAMGGVIFGYDIGISGGVTSMEPFLEKFFHQVYTKMKQDTEVSNYCKFDSQLLTSFTSSLYVAGLVASFFASWLTKSRGRKPSILLGGGAFLAGAALGGAASNVYMLIFGRVLLGVGVGFANQAVPLYLSEMAPPRYRGAINNGFQLSVGIGVLAANLINFGTEKIRSGYGWRISLSMAAVPAAILTVGAIFLPETPSSLIQLTNDKDRARRLLQRVRGTSEVQSELADLIEASELSKSIDHNPFRKILEAKTIGMGESASLMSAILTGAVGIATTFLSMVIVDRVGRRPLFLVGGVLMLVSQVLVGAIMAAELGDHGGIGKRYAVAVIVLIGFYVAGFGVSWGPLGWLVPSEIFPLEIRSAGQSIVVAVSFLFTFVVAQTFLSMLCHLKAGIFFFFGGWVVVMTVFVYLLLPETKGLPIEKMGDVWREHWFWNRVVVVGGPGVGEHLPAKFGEGGSQSSVVDL